VAALTAGVIYFATRTKESGEAALDLAIANRQASKAEEEHKKVLSDLTTKMGEGAKATRDAAKASREKAQADLVQAKAALKAALAEREKAAAQAKSAMNTARTQTGVGEDRRFTTLGVGVIGRTGIAKADAAAVEAKADIATLERRIRELDDGLTSPALPSSTSGGKADKGKSKKPTGPTAEEIEARFQSELANEIQRTLSARRNLAVTAEEQAALERQALDNAVRQYEAETRANKEYTDGQKAQLIEQARETAALEHLRISRDEREAIEQRALEARRENDRYEHDALQAQADLADTRKDSLAAERRILDWMEQREQAELEAAIAAGKIADAAKARADLETMQGARRQRTERDHESPLGRYQRDLESFDYDDAREQAAVDAMDRLGDSVANTATQYLKLGGIAGDVINGLIKDLVRLAIQQTIVKSIVGGVSKIFEIFGASTPSSASFPGFDPSKIPGYGGVMSIRNAASGTDFAHGGIYRVGEAGPETVMLPRGARVIPNTNMAAAGRNVTNVTQVLRLDLSNAVLTPELLAQMNQMAQGAAVGGAMAGSNLAQNSMSRRARNRIP